MPPDSRKRPYRIADVARIAGVTVRTLRYYDELGLLSPGRSLSGYRLYGDDDLLRLQQILIRREFGFPLENIRAALDDPAFDHAAALKMQRTAMARRRDDAAAMLASIDAALALISNPRKDSPMTGKLFDGFDAAAHDAEAAERWGGTAAYKESARRTKRYTEAEWRTLNAEKAALDQRAADAMSRGVEPDSAEGRAIADAFRRHVDRWFYPCSRDMHARLADLWDSDPRFSASIDRAAPGLTRWLVAAVRSASSPSVT